MLTLDDRLTVNENDVAAEVMEGEAIIINLATGVYYSMDGSGGYLWSLVEEGRPLRAIAEALEARFGVERERAEEDVIAVAERLVEERGLTYIPPFDDPHVTASLDWLLKQKYDGNLRHFWYLNYYAMQAYFQAGGEHWSHWQQQVKQFLLANQNADGSVTIPEVLRPYMYGMEVIEP